MAVKVTRDLEKLKKAQAERGVIPSLRGKFYIGEGGGNPRRPLAAKSAALARMHLSGLSTEGIPMEYSFLGGHYAPGGFIENFRSFGLEDFRPHVRKLLDRAKSSRKKIRWLDIGPGLPVNFVPYFENKDPKNKLIELHTLSPEQILPKKPKSADSRLSAGELRDSVFDAFLKKTAPDADFDKFRERFTHHVGLVETYNPRKLGTFPLIVSIFGGTHYASHPEETLTKVARMLDKNGKAFLTFDGNKLLDVESCKRELGNQFHFQHAATRSTHYVIVTRKN